MNDKQVNDARSKLLRLAADEILGCLTFPVETSQASYFFFQDPWQALKLAWLWRWDLKYGPLWDSRFDDLRQAFSAALHEICPMFVRVGPPPRYPYRPRATPATREPAKIDNSAFDAYLWRLFDLMSMWCKYALGSENPNPAHWYASHPDVFSKVRHAVKLRSTELCLQFPGSTSSQPVSDPAASELPLISTPKVVTRARFILPAGWQNAVDTVAYAAFADFLGKLAHDARFCRKCGRPFDKRAGAIYCSELCSHSGSTNLVQMASRRNEGLRYFKSIQEIVQKHKSSINVSGDDIQAELDEIISTSVDRRSRRVGLYLKAAKAGTNSPERTSILRSLAPPALSGLETPSNAELHNLSQELRFDETLDWIRTKCSERKRKKRR